MPIAELNLQLKCPYHQVSNFPCPWLDQAIFCCTVGSDKAFQKSVCAATIKPINLRTGSQTFLCYYYIVLCLTSSSLFSTIWRQKKSASRVSSGINSNLLAMSWLGMSPYVEMPMFPIRIWLSAFANAMAIALKASALSLQPLDVLWNTVLDYARDIFF